MKKILIALLLTLSAEAKLITCDIFQIENVITKEKTFSAKQRQFFIAEGIVYLLEDSGVIPMEYSDYGISTSKVRYKIFIDKLGNKLAIYNNFKEGAYLYSKDLSRFETLTKCK